MGKINHEDEDIVQIILFYSHSTLPHPSATNLCQPLLPTLGPILLSKQANMEMAAYKMVQICIQM